MVGVPGLEPGTSALSVLRSNQLSYTPLFFVCLEDTRIFFSIFDRKSSFFSFFIVFGGETDLSMKGEIFENAKSPEKAFKKTNSCEVLGEGHFPE